MKKIIRAWVLDPIIKIFSQYIIDCQRNLAKVTSEYDKEYWLGKHTAFGDAKRILEAYRSGSLD